MKSNDEIAEEIKEIIIEKARGLNNIDFIEVLEHVIFSLEIEIQAMEESIN